MPTLARLHILETLARGRVETYRAIDSQTRQQVLLHYADAAIFDLADELGNDVLDWGQTNQRHYIVTRDRPEYADLNSRIRPWPHPDLSLRNAGRWTSPSGVSPGPSAAPSSPSRNNMTEKDDPKDKNPSPEAGEFTRMFQVPGAAPEPATGEPGASEPGEFTRMFQAVRPQAEAQVSARTPEPSAAPKEPPLPVPPANVRIEERGEQARPEFTRIVQRTPQPQRPARPSAPPPTSSPAETTVISQPAQAAGTGNLNVSRDQRERVSPSESEPANQPGEFTSLFPAAQTTPSKPEPVAAPSAPASFPPPAAEPKPGSFTEFFRQPAPTSKPAAPPPPAPPNTPSQPSSFTDFFRQPAPPPQPASPQKASAPAQSKGSEFTRFFEDPLGSSNKQVDWRAVQNAPAPAPQPKAPGEFTRMFGKPDGAEPAKSPFMPPGGREGATDIFQSHSGKPGPADARPQIDDFGRLFANQPQDQVSAPASPKPASPPASVEAAAPIGKKLPKAPPMILLIVIIIAIVVVSGCAFYYFVLRK